ncbi:hypothetical protein GCM10009864_62420 [Streptomyces lunalinharesii]|uniref:Uncharacterized protein n=1 Tax=Streptomyces lunalinharesii TaxID=333384 RepID=A0ABP6F0X1_9ACTN
MARPKEFDPRSTLGGTSLQDLVDALGTNRSSSATEGHHTAADRTPRYGKHLHRPAGQEHGPGRVSPGR